ncbi:hypothetical protein SCLCIDRAFT_31001 [Scleroderma citrinum Foug A]|uniref:Uncharacterized protein n=1 Tax=Scleroderma citrinum Foug A TaxID=1036808 RepID=A0A0C2ZPN9_9AGAM|nr:hypothetical protein SCLCIDRAFT_31001 [Scleroderma citrinum Foug A]
MLPDSQAQYMEATEATSASTSMPSLNLVNAVGLGSPASSPIVGLPPSNEILPPRSRRLPARFHDLLPTPLFNLWGIACEYRHRPSHDPDAFLSTKDLSNFTCSALKQVGHDPSARQEGPSPLRDNHAPPWPWANMSVWRVMNWRLTGSAQKSSAEVNRLVREVIQAEDFNILELDGFNAHTETSCLDAAERALPEDDPFGIDQWKTTNVEISVPTREKNPEGNGRAFCVEGLRYRPLTSVVRAVFAEALSKLFHLTPFKHIWRSPLTGCEQRVYDELYTSDAWIQAHDEIMKQRFANIPSFGLSAIHKFPSNIADTIQCAAQHFEDMLQCAMPAFEGLLPQEHDTIVQVLLFCLCEWHALAKLRLHTDTSLELPGQSLRQLSAQIQRFQSCTCVAFQMVELPNEAAQQQRWEVAGLQSGQQTKPLRSGPRCKTFNINTYKFHALGDYTGTIKMFGTTDSYTTQIGELAHQIIKRFYGQSNKKNVVNQFATQERQHTVLRQQREALDPGVSDTDSGDDDLEVHHVMTDIPRHDNTFSLADLIGKYHDDPAMKQPDFVQKLKNHLLLRLLGLDYDGDERSFLPEDRNSLHLTNQRMVESKIFQVNYTTYDICRDQDMIRPGSKSSVIMTLSKESNPAA